MSIQRRSLGAIEYNRVLQRACPVRLQLIRAHTYNCVGGTCFTNGRKSISGACPICAGTGYLPSRAPTLPQLPNADSYFITADLQVGHGLYGAGGSMLRLVADIGKENIGDATLFTKFQDYDYRTGKMIFPIVDKSLPQPDRIVARSGEVYNIVRALPVSIGCEDIARVFACEIGSFSVSGGR